MQDLVVQVSSYLTHWFGLHRAEFQSPHYSQPSRKTVQNPAFSLIHNFRS